MVDWWVPMLTTDEAVRLVGGTWGTASNPFEGVRQLGGG